MGNPAELGAAPLQGLRAGIVRVSGGCPGGVRVSRRHPRDVQGVSRVCPGCVQEVSRMSKCPGGVQEMSSRCLSVQEVSRGCPMSRRCPRGVQEVSKGRGGVQGVSRGCPVSPRQPWAWKAPQGRDQGSGLGFQERGWNSQGMDTHSSHHRDEPFPKKNKKWRHFSQKKHPRKGKAPSQEKRGELG